VITRQSATARADIVQRVFDHVTMRVSDREASERFYRTVPAVLGIEVVNHHR
jgi:hypothetical protein